MKPVITFFLFLCFQLLGASVSPVAVAHASTLSLSISHPAQSRQQLDNYVQKHDYNFSKAGHSSKQSTYSISAEDTDEDEDFIKKHTSFVKCFLGYSYPHILSHFFTPRLTQHSFGNIAYYSGCPKYILQRVIRI